MGTKRRRVMTYRKKKEIKNEKKKKEKKYSAALDPLRLHRCTRRLYINARNTRSITPWVSWMFHRCAMCITVYPPRGPWNITSRPVFLAATPNGIYDSSRRRISWIFFARLLRTTRSDTLLPRSFTSRSRFSSWRGPLGFPVTKWHGASCFVATRAEVFELRR